MKAIIRYYHWCKMFVEQMSREKNLIDFDWEAYSPDYVPYAIEKPEVLNTKCVYNERPPVIDINYAFSYFSRMYDWPDYLSYISSYPLPSTFSNIYGVLQEYEVDVIYAVPEIEVVT